MLAKPEAHVARFGSGILCLLEFTEGNTKDF
jgi:hypothetical protein